MDDSVLCRPTTSEVRVRLVGRRSSDIIKSAGHKIGAAETESVIPELAGVAEVAVTGEPDDDLGERVVAWIETRYQSHVLRCRRHEYPCRH